MADPAAAPDPFWKGNVAIYETPDGGAVVAYRADQEDEDSHHPIPARVWGLIVAALNGEPINLSPVQLVRQLISR